MLHRKLQSGIRTAFIVAVAAVSVAAQASNSDLKLRFYKPASTWTEALPLGNGRIGAMVFGGLEDERLQINESTLWGGGPHDYTNPDAYSHLNEIRQLIFAGKVDEAEKLSENLMGKPKLLMPYQPFCDLRLHFPGHAQATDYQRELQLDDAIAETVYKAGSGSANHRQPTRTAHLQCRDGFAARWDERRNYRKKHSGTGRSNPASAKSSFFLDGLLGPARYALRCHTKSIA